MGEPKSKQFENIYYGLSNSPGILKLAPSGLGWKTPDSDSIVTISADEFKRVHWIRVARDYQIKFALKNGNAARFDGFPKENFESLREIIRTNYKLNLETKEICVKGWNWGETDFQGSQLLFNISKKTAFEIPLSHVSNTNLQNKCEVSLEFMQPEPFGEDSQSRSHRTPTHELVEMRFYIPGSTKVVKDGETEDEAGEEVEVEEEEEMSLASLFFEEVREKADLTQVSGEGIVLFNDVLLLTPRGRYDIEMFSSFFRLRGKTYDYKVQYSSVGSLFLLPKLDDLHEMFVIGLDPPLRQGQTLYPFLVLQFKKEEEKEFNLNLDAEVNEKEYGGRLETTYDGAIYHVFSVVFRELTKRKIIKPSGFKSQHDEVAVKCSLKANEGYLYPLEKCFLFIPKPPTLIKTSEIEKVIFTRVSATAVKAPITSARTFDLKFRMKGNFEYQFSSINREEFEHLEEYFRSKKVITENDTSDTQTIQTFMNDISGSSDDEVIPASKRRQIDEDFQLDDSESDVAEEYDENYAGAGSSTEEDEPPKKKVKKSVKSRAEK
ncbi:SSrecog-domain-containing protein [Gigaspora rosea]|uniref:FACT complex subunit POB3 n=1 Tax=Gigaspora rosea TaxID=44941 RepID=A0A397VN90_9GLOM|nr:SSrecog-domain-containing protein [Gigaspora rosea]